MAATSRELVLQTLNFENPSRAPRQLWLLPWAATRFPQELEKLRADFPDDIIHANGHLKEIPVTKGDPYKVGEFTDDWGSTFINAQEGVIGEVKDPLVKDWETDVPKIHIPKEWLSIDPDQINRDCDATDKFVLAGACPRPFEQLQFLRRTDYLYMDLCIQPPAMMAFIKEMHNFYCELMLKWAKTNVDALIFMDDWGSQLNLLISPEQWKEYFKPLYKDYIDIAHSHGKKIFMHSDGNILLIYPELIELGLDCVNSQVFCMGLDKVAEFAGKISFWGEIDRQHLLPNATTAEIDQAVKELASKLWKQGGCIAQCEFGPGGKPENVYQTFKSWNEVIKAD